MGCLNGKFLTHRSSETVRTVSNRNNCALYPKGGDSANSSSPDQDKLLEEQKLGNGTSGTNERTASKKSKKPKLLSSMVDRGKNSRQVENDSQSGSPSGSNIKSLSFFGRRLGTVGFSRNVDGIGGGSSGSSLGNQQNGSILHSLGTLLENGGRSSSSPRLPTAHSESNIDSPLTPDRLHKNFQDRLLTSQVSRNNQKLTDSQLEFFRMLDEKIAQGREDDSWDSKSANV